MGLSTYKEAFIYSVGYIYDKMVEIITIANVVKAYKAGHYIPPITYYIHQNTTQNTFTCGSQLNYPMVHHV